MAEAPKRRVIRSSRARTRSMVACKVCGAHFDLVPGSVLFEDEPLDRLPSRAGACPVCGSTRLYEGDDFFAVPAA